MSKSALSGGFPVLLSGPMRITRVSTERHCAVCERTLLMGERSARFSPNGPESFVDVCQLCTETAYEYGWSKEGAPTTPTISPDRRRSRFSFGSLIGRPNGQAPVASDPILKRLSEADLTIVEAADRFNSSQYRRTVGGIAKSLGEPNVSIVALSGVNADVIVTVAWGISWYQYRITTDTAPIRLAERGDDPSDLEGSFTEWNAHMEDDGRIVPDIARL
jgi:hypothetical protein